MRLDTRLAPAYRFLGYALVALGRFSEAVEQWAQWEPLATASTEEMAQLEAVRRARGAAQVLSGMGAVAHG